MLMKNTRVNNLVVLIIGLTFALCKNRELVELPVKEFVEAVETKSSGIFSKTIGDITYSLQYKPLDYVILRELKEDKNNTDKYKELIKEYGQYEYYTLELKANEFNDEILKYNLHSEKDYEDRVKYYAFKFQDDLTLIQDNDTSHCLSYHFERNYGLSPKVKFLLGFKKLNDEKDRVFVCNEPFLGNSIVKINIDPQELKRIPKLKLN